MDYMRLRFSKPYDAASTGSTISWTNGEALQSVTSLPQDSHLAIVNSLAGLTDMGPAWKQLEENCQNKVTAFQSFDWISAWAEVYARSNAATEILIAAGYTKGQLVFVWPLMSARSHGVRSLVWLTEPSGQYGDILLHKEHAVSVWMPAALKLLSQIKGVDLIRLRHNRADSNAAQYLFKNFKSGHNTERAPFLDLKDFSNEELYDARYTSNQRKRRKKIRKSLEQLGQVRFTTLATGTDNDRAMAKAIEEKNKWLKERGRVNRILSCPLHLEFLKVLSRRTNSSVAVVTTEMSVGGKPVSWEIGFRFLQTHFAYITSHDNKMTDLSPGRLHMDLSQRQAIKDKFEKFDLMLPNDPHKESWSSDMVETRDVYLPLSTKGRLYGSLYIQKVRPLVRKLYYSAPQPLLAALRRLFVY
jgi:CelD/BcsL family acetyltransferase involved in cellulose biosynthesis